MRESQVCRTISHILLHNSKKNKSKDTIRSRHTRRITTTACLYRIECPHTHQKQNKLDKLGLSISYQRVLQIENSLSMPACELFENEGVVCSSNIRQGLFAVAAIDNIDHNPSSTTAQGSFHGTGINVIQFPKVHVLGSCRQSNFKHHTSTREQFFPDEFTIVPAVSLNMSSINVRAPAIVIK